VKPGRLVWVRRHNGGMRTIALEEHFWTPELAGQTGTGPLAAFGDVIGNQLEDLGELRLADMDANGTADPRAASTGTRACA
jgi:hypothetical protein